MKPRAMALVDLETAKTASVVADFLGKSDEIGQLAVRSVFGELITDDPDDGWVVVSSDTDVPAREIVRSLRAAGFPAYVELPLTSRAQSAASTLSDGTYDYKYGRDVGGIDAISNVAHTRCGAGVEIGVIEIAWPVRPGALHPYLKSSLESPLETLCDGGTDHCIYTLGVLAAALEGEQRGLCNDAEFKVDSPFRRPSGEGCSSLDREHMAATIRRLAASLADGAVLLIEAEDSYYPVEMDYLTHAEISAISDRIVVVEPAGNNCSNLSDYSLSGPRGSTDWTPSGAVLVGATQSSGGERYVHSNYWTGEVQVRMQALGENVRTINSSTGSLDFHEYQYTSAASAIVAGAFTLAQAMVGTLCPGRKMNAQPLIMALQATGYVTADDHAWVRPNLSTLWDRLNDLHDRGCLVEALFPDAAAPSRRA